MSQLWKWITWLSLAGLLTACGSESDSETTGVSNPEFSGLWVGVTEENLGAAASPTEIPTFVLFHNDLVFLLREDEAQVGTYLIEDNDLSTFEMDVYPYASPDTDNKFYVGTDDSNNLTLSALKATPTQFVINYNNTTRAGRIDVDLDNNQVSGIGINNVQGEWTTTDASMIVSSDGGFSGWNSATSCQWEGNLSALTDTLLALQIQRENCTEFNITGTNFAEGMALIDGTGALHFLATNASDILWMQFTSTAQTPAQEPETEEAEEEAAP
jgi:hypothetical protein